MTTGALSGSLTPATSGPLAVTPGQPAVTHVSPSAGPTAGGTTVTITGTNLGTAKTTSVTFGKLVGKITSDTGTKLVVKSPAAKAGMVDVTVTTAGGVSSTLPADQFTFVAAPTVKGIRPTSGPLTGGSSVTITGTNLGSLAMATVKFGKLAGTIVSDTGGTIVVTSPAAKAGTVDVTVATAGGTSATSKADKYTFAAAPIITGTKPASGSPAGGTVVTITGKNLLNAAVYFGALPAASITSDTATTIVAKSPAGKAGTVDVTVVTAGGTSATSAADKFTYVALPTVTKITPTAGPLGTQVTITGKNLLDFTAVDFGTTEATVFGIESATRIVVDSPLSSGTGPVDVTVTTAGGTSPTSAHDKFTYATVGSSPSVIGNGAVTADVNDIALLDMMDPSGSMATIQRKKAEGLVPSPFS